MGTNRMTKPIIFPGFNLASRANKLSVTPDKPRQDPKGWTVEKNRLENIPPKTQYNDSDMPLLDNMGTTDFPKMWKPYKFNARCMKVE
mmetsp:Transcript_2461/g.3629  ORF Transcript_2461/g.3629 Transcript_2461/m.3629 type:complete len:88 (-) Transcript_2461:360-623(-)